MQILNFTPHPINFISPDSVRYNSSIKKIVSNDPKIYRVLESNGMLSVKYEITKGTSLDGIPIRVKNKLRIDPIPDYCDIAIVSSIYAAASDDPRAYTVIHVVFDPTGKKILGSLGIERINN